MLHLGQLPGAAAVTSGCIGQTYTAPFGATLADAAGAAAVVAGAWECAWPCALA